MKISIKSKQWVKEWMWIGIFFLILATFTLPAILLSIQFKFGVSMACQAMIVVLATLVVQLFRKENMGQITGRLDLVWLKKSFTGLMIGAALMLLPAAILGSGGWVSWTVADFKWDSILEITLLFAAVAVAEELLFRGFIFQRLIKSIGQWPTQLLIGAYFLLIHLNNPGMTGTVKAFASVNIFLASVMFGLAVIRFKSLAVAIGIHFMANWVQGILLGFAVSGKPGSSFLVPVVSKAPVWLTGGAFGLEASLPGLICVILTIIFLYRSKPSR